MVTNTELHGACLCGIVSVTVTTKSNHVGVCHCSMCRKWGGGPLFAVEFASSSEWAERGFCQQCGTHLFYRLKQGGHYALPVGLLDSADDWKITEQIFIDQKPPYYSLAEKTKQLTGEEVFAQFGEQ